MPPKINERFTLTMLAAVQFTHIMDFMIMMPLGSTLMRVFSISPAQFSYLVAVYGLAAAVTGFLGGFVLDRFDRKHALLVLYAGFAIATIGCAVAPTYTTLLAARFAAGAFGGLAGSIVTAMVGDVIPPERRGQGMGFVMAAFPLASVLGVPVGLTLANAFEWHAPFFLLGGLSIVVLICAARILPSLKPVQTDEHPLRRMTVILSERIHLRGLMMSAMLVFAGGCVIPFMAPAMVANVGVPESRLQYIYFAGGLATFFTTPWIGRLSDRYDKLKVLIVLSAASSVVVLILTNLGPVSLPLAMATTAAFMVAMSGRFSPAMAMLTNAIDSRYRGGFMAVNSAVQQASSALANYVAGTLVTAGVGGRLVGYPQVGLIALVCFWITVVLAWRLRAVAPHAAQPGGMLVPKNAMASD